MALATERFGFCHVVPGDRWVSMADFYFQKKKKNREGSAVNIFKIDMPFADDRNVISMAFS